MESTNAGTESCKEFGGAENIDNKNELKELPTAKPSWYYSGIQKDIWLGSLGMWDKCSQK